MFLHRLEATPDRPAFQTPDGAGWKTLTWKETGQRVRWIASGLRALGLADEERCAILSGTRLEWILVDLGILCGGGATTTIYPANTGEECAYILSDSNSAFLFAETEKHVATIRAVKDKIPGVRKVIAFDAPASEDGWVITLEQLIEKGRAYDAEDPARFERIAREVKGAALATLIYTSGTTGQPKGVELLHDTWAYEGEAIDSLGFLNIDDVQYLWLPMAHVFGKVLEAAQVRIGFLTAIDGRIDKIVGNLGVVRPTFVAAVPRIFEKVYNGAIAKAKEGGALKYSIFRWAIGVGKQVSRAKQRGDRPGALVALQYKVADRLVFGTLRARFGGRVRGFISGSAPLARDLADFFDAAGILILEGYGLTESAAASFVNRPENYKIGTVGKPLLGTEVKIAPEDGEILIRGRGVMRAYHNKPDATKEALDAEGWLHTGDIGELVDGGFLKITDRKKDLIKTSGGKYVAPQAIEGKLKALCPYISQVVVHGNNRNFCVALITLEEEATRKWARENGLGELRYADLATNPKVRALIKEHVDRLNQGLASYESVKDFALLPADLTPESGDLTASLKVKRKHVEQKYKTELDAFYAKALERI
jgi:long-chain acyl-CoA synthetase